MRGESYKLVVEFDMQARSPEEAHEVLYRLLDSLPRRQAGSPGMNEYWMPLESRCDECGAEAGRMCEPYCTSPANAILPR